MVFASVSFVSDAASARLSYMPVKVKKACKKRRCWRPAKACEAGKAYSWSGRQLVDQFQTSRPINALTPKSS